MVRRVGAWSWNNIKSKHVQVGFPQCEFSKIVDARGSIHHLLQIVRFV